MLKKIKISGSGCLDIVFLKEMFNEIDKEADGEIYYREMVNHLHSLNSNLDQESNPQVMSFINEQCTVG
jgi:Ca2+-binding EF-hand superfamily protein